MACSVLDGRGYERVRLRTLAIDYLTEIANGDGAFRAVEHRILAVADTAEAQEVMPRFTREELDFVAPLVGAPQTRTYKESPFIRPDRNTDTAA